MQGIVGDQDVIGGAEMAAAGEVIALPMGKALLLFTERFRGAQQIPFLPLTDGVELPEPIRSICGRLSQRGRIAYVEAESFGGEGTQAAVVWDQGKMILPPIVEPRAINRALRELGVRVSTSTDEFDALQLGAHRDIEDWVSPTDVD
jgi:hypothetical protein